MSMKAFTVSASAALAVLLAAGCQPRPPEPVTAVQAPLPDPGEPWPKGDTTVLARCVKTDHYATTTRGKWRTTWFFHKLRVIRTERGHCPHSELRLVRPERWPLPGSNIWVKKARNPYQLGQVLAIALDTTKNPAQIVGHERRSCLPPHKKLTLSALQKPDKAMLDRMTAKVHERAKRVGTRTDLPIRFVEATRDSYVVYHDRETLVLDKKSLKVSPFGVKKCAGAFWREGPWFWMRTYPRAKLGLSGKVADVRCGTRIAISCRAATGILEGDIFEIRRGGKTLGRAKVDTVWDDFAGLKPLDSMRWKPSDDAVLVQLAPKKPINTTPYAEHLTGTWRDEQASFDFTILKGRRRGFFKATITIRNLTDKFLSFPTPMLMPAAGDTNKNNIRVYDSQGNKLGFGAPHPHTDGLRPVVDIPAQTSRSWSFPLRRYWPQMSSPGRYAVEFWYFSYKHNLRATWKGRVKMGRLLVKSKD
jgi:hypothetical protein